MACLAALCAVLLFNAGPTHAQGTATVHSSGTLTVSDGALRLGGDFVNEGTFDATSAAVAFVGTTGQTFTPGAEATLEKIVLDQAAADTVHLANDLAVTDSVVVRTGALNLNGQTIDLGSTGTLNEADGHTVTGTSGTITATRFLNAPNAVNVAGLGAQITSDANMSATTVTRGHAPQSGTNANESIARYYDIAPGVNSGLDATLEFFYDDTELNNLDAATLELWRSDDDGASYVHVGGTASPSVNVVVLSGIESFARITAASSDAPLPVELASFEARRNEDAVTLTWETLSETNSASFEVQRAEDAPGDSSGGWSAVGRVSAAGTTTEKQTYRFSDADLPYAAETLRYRLKQVDRDGSARYEGEVEIALSTPDAFALHGNYPNPFRNQTTIRYELPRPVQVQLAVYDVLGRRVKVLVDEQQPAGRKELHFDAAELPSGTYFYRLETGNQVETRRLTVVR